MDGGLLRGEREGWMDGVMGRSANRFGLSYAGVKSGS